MRCLTNVAARYRRWRQYAIYSSGSAPLLSQSHYRRVPGRGAAQLTCQNMLDPDADPEDELLSCPHHYDERVL